jgi:hypothetical protein
MDGKDFHTKKDLEAQFNISDVTVTSTMQACGLNTRKKKYTQEEVDKFQQARELFAEGMTHREVEQYFGIQQEETEQPFAELEESTPNYEPTQEFDTSEYITQHRELLGNTITQTLGSTVVEIAEEKAKEVAQLMPALVLSALNQELNKEEILEQIRTSKKKKEGGVPAFLLRKIQIKEVKTEPAKLNGQAQKQLPQASPENSVEES